MKLSEALELIRKEFERIAEEQIRGELSRSTMMFVFDRACAAVVLRHNEQQARGERIDAILEASK